MNTETHCITKIHKYIYFKEKSNFVVVVFVSIFTYFRRPGSLFFTRILNWIVLFPINRRIIAALLFIVSLLYFCTLQSNFFFVVALGMGLCVAFIALVRLPSLKVSTLLLLGLLVYDVFWVSTSIYPSGISYY